MGTVSGKAGGNGGGVDVPVGGECTGEDCATRGIGGVDVCAGVEGVLNGGSTTLGGSL